MDGEKEMKEMEENHEYICQQIDKIIQNKIRKLSVDKITWDKMIQDKIERTKIK